MVGAFELAPTPEIHFGPGTLDLLPGLAAGYGETVLLFTGGSSLRESGTFGRLSGALAERGMGMEDVRVDGEPSPDLVDAVCERYRERGVDVVLAVGGGSVIDAGKAVSAMLPCEESVLEYLEGVGEGREHGGEKVPFVAVPTTSGTGSEATKNAVLSRVGRDGFKRSLRHDNFIPDIALVDPELTISCPPEVTAASGLDAISQLLGAYVSTSASVPIDSLIEGALVAVGRGFETACREDPRDVGARAGMSYAALVSGIALANAGLGIVHGLASPIGGFFEIPHGIVCGSLLGEATRMNMELLDPGDPRDREYLGKYARAGSLLGGGDPSGAGGDDLEAGAALLVETIEGWIDRLSIPRLGDYGVGEGDVGRIAERAGLKNNPVKLGTGQIRELVRRRL